MKAIPILWLSVALVASTAVAQKSTQTRSAFEEAKWQKGPAVVSMGSVAQIRLPKGYMFADAADTKRLMEAMENPTSGLECGFVAPEDLQWFALYLYEETGYVRDDEQGSLDPAKILKTIQQATEKSNEVRRQRGWSVTSVTGWYKPPQYDPTTHNLEWAINGESQAEHVVNYQTRVLGRGGVMHVTLVVAPSMLSAIMPEYRKLLGQFAYNPGSKYAEYRQGDKVAKYGLAALVVGGAAAVAVKSGAFKWIGKVLIAAFIALGALVKRLFSRKKTLGPG